MQKRRGISPVIATVIIVAVTIAVAIAVAFWMTGIVGLFTGFEQLQITSIYDDTNGIYVTVQNTGTSTATITDIFVNGLPSTQVGLQVELQNIQGNVQGDLATGGITFPAGSSATLHITLNNPPFTVRPGVSLEIKLHTAGGKDYPKLIVLQAYRARALAEETIQNS
ncbi:MAG: archaellin/type IV pilin N-terminal domain-containing protein [Thermofilum sp.]|uniref:archaellin/type IV pilin N-terminal domain-containing protein n=1 Tax=Thermofilum sp. TaxID=1961369 RepID=UPI00317A09FE